MAEYKSTSLENSSSNSLRARHIVKSVLNRIILHKNVCIAVHFSHNEEVPQALPAMTINEVLDPNWYAPIGGTTHMTNDPGILLLALLIKGKIKCIEPDWALHKKSILFHLLPKFNDKIIFSYSKN